MPKVLIKRDNGDAFYSETIYMEGNPLPKEGGMKLSPDDLVDGKPVREWPVGVFTIRDVELSTQSRFTDWSIDTLKVELDVDLSRDAALAMNSELFLEERKGEKARDAFVKEIEDAGSYRNLSKETAAFIRRCLNRDDS